MTLPLLSAQPLPPGGPKRPDGRFSELYLFSPISPTIADSNRRFHPPDEGAHPLELFVVRFNTCTVVGYRFIRTTNPKQMLMFIDGACSNNGTSEARGGCGVVYSSIHWASGITYPLEIDGTPHTSNRAELRAAILAVRMRAWNGEGFSNVVLACDSEYIVKGASQWLNKWVKNGWKTSQGTAVKNKDLWEALLEAMREHEKSGVLVQFWLIPRAWNEADEYAKNASAGEGKRSSGPVVPFHLLERTTGTHN